MTLEEKHVAILIASIPDNLSKGFFFGWENLNVDSLACSLDSEISEIQPGPSQGLCFLVRGHLPPFVYHFP